MRLHLGDPAFIRSVAFNRVNTVHAHWFSVCNIGPRGICEGFDIKNSVKQKCNMSGTLLMIIMDWVMRRTGGNGEKGIK